ncbi:MAG: phosphoadenosine phosphosulfate reductase [Alphaproteobacteria bacterium]|nr:MAG: phosphoadenosine phosphosulfate reductase [Alphaproteobacteria bacterium]
MNVISSSYGNDSVALIQWAAENCLPDITVVFVDTGWSKPGWLERVERSEEWVRSQGFQVVTIKPEVQFEELMRRKKGFPNQRHQRCSALLKGLPFLTWIDEADPDCRATVLIGKRREESEDRKDTPEFVESSPYHGGRKVWNPLYLHAEAQRDELLGRAGVEKLQHRSDECSPCVNANKGDLRRLTPFEIERLKNLEAETGQTMFRTKKKGGAKGIEQVIQWAYSGRGRYNPKQESMFNSCSSGYCGY